VKTIQRVELAGFVAVSVLWLGAAFALCQVSDDTRGAPDQPVHFLLANALLRLGNVDQAISEYRLAIELSPDQPRTYYQLALALLSKQDQAGAEDELAKALSIDGHYAPALIETGRLLISQNRLSDAVTQLNLAIQDNPNAEQAYFLLAKAYSQLGDKEKSDEMAKRLVIVRNTNWKSSGNKDGSQSAPNPTTSH
jgi:tetratricopeptide (TPR) repeat protein